MPSQLPRPISHIYFRGCSKETEKELLARMPIREGAIFSDDLLQRALQAAKSCDERLEVFVDQTLPREEYLKLPEELRHKVRPPAGDDGVNVTIYDPACVPQRIRVEGDVQEAMLIEKVMPALAARAVQLEVAVGKDGTVIDVRPLAGPESRMDTAMDAVKKWKYRPTLLNGLPVEVQTTVQV